MADDICDWLAKEEADAEEWGGLGGARYYRKQFAAARAEIERLRAEVQAMRRFIQDTAIDNGITAADSEDRFWRLSDGTYMPQSVIDLVWSKEARRG